MSRTAERRSQLPLPDGITPERFMATMATGHGYRWTILSKIPVLVAHAGTSTPGLTEMLLVNRSIVFESDAVFGERLSRLLEAMRRTQRMGGA